MRARQSTPRFQAAIRMGALALLFAAEMLAATVWLDGASPVPAGSPLAAAIHVWGSSLARFAVAFCAMFATFAWLKFRTGLKPLVEQLEPVAWRWLAAHFAAIGLFAAASLRIYGDHLQWVDANIAAALWILAGVAAIVFAAASLFAGAFWTGLLHVTGSLWLYIAGAAVLTSAAASGFRALWTPASRVTFQMVRLFLSPFIAEPVIQPEQLRIGTHRFTVIIADECSGLEGIGLLLIFAVIWLVLFREEARFPQALALLPLGVAALFVLNALRITALVLIGNAGAREIATGGFHSQAGWIAFNLVAFGSSILARRWSWVSAGAPAPSEPAIEADSTAALLLPFLAILAAGMISRAASGGFEWFYPLRILAAAGTLWIFRKSYRSLDWHFGAPAAIVGMATAIVWVAADHFGHGTAAMPAALAAATAPLRTLWVISRILGAALTVPLAEELAFRGYLLRRLSGADFESIPFAATTPIAVVVSSILFGGMHGGQWLLGIFAGFAYALLVRRTGRIGDAVAAHALTNLILAMLVLFGGQWQLWW